jgi:nickel-dependent lactate racemase
MKITLPYGREGLDITVPDKNLMKVLRFTPAEPLSDPKAFISGLLQKPIGAPPLSHIAAGKGDACIVITDITRPTPHRVVLPPVLDALEAAGIGREHITLLVATGLHEPMGAKELEAMLGNEILARCRVENHSAVDASGLRHIGSTAAGTKAFVNRRYLDASLKIVTGLIEPHFMAGFSGGRKCVCPGISGAETIAAIHSPAFLEHPRSRNGILEGNIFHREISEVAAMAGADFTLNVMIDEQHHVTGAVAGDMEEAHSEGAAMVARMNTDTVPEAADIVITTNSGYPLDQNLYQAVKGMVCALDIVRDGGSIITASRCEAGLGSREFVELLECFAGPDEFLNTISCPGYYKKDQWEVEELCIALRKAKIMIYTEGVECETLCRYGLDPLKSVEEGITRCMETYGPDAKIAVIPAGPNLIARIAGKN